VLDWGEHDFRHAVLMRVLLQTLLSTMHCSRVSARFGSARFGFDWPPNKSHAQAFLNQATSACVQTVEGINSLHTLLQARAIALQSTSS
jgi:hypothetical protein